MPDAPASAGDVDRLSGFALAASHDFNDELTFVLNHAEISLGLVGADHPAGSSLMELRQSALRCAEIARCLALLTLRARDGCLR